MGKRVSGRNLPKNKILPRKRVSLESLEQRQLYASDLGINVNRINADNYSSIVEVLRAADVKSVRLWYGINTYQTREVMPVVRYAAKLHNDGFQVTLSVNPELGRHGTADETRGFFEFLATQPGITDSVDVWELGNEPDSNVYWRGTLPEFVSDYVAPAARVLHNLGEKVASGGVAWNPKDVKTMVDAGLLNSVDYVGIHPYARSIGALKNQIAEVKTYVGGTPLIATEWNLRGHEKDGNKSAWAEGIAAMWPIIRANFAISHYFVTTVMDSLAGPAGILTTEGRANEPFYSTFMGLQDDLSDGTVDGGSGTGPIDTPTDGGSTGGTDTGNTGGTDTGGTSGGSTGGGTDTSNDGATTGGTGSGGTDTSTDGSGDGSTSNGGTQSGGSTGGGTTTGGSTSTDSDPDATDGAGSTTDTTPPVKKPTKHGHTTTPSTPSTPTRPTTGTVTPTVPVDPPVVVVPPEITSFSLINASRDRIVKPYAVLSGVNTIDLANTSTAFLSLLASGNRKTGSVVWTINGNTVVDSDGTFTLFGEKSGDLVGSVFEAGRNYVLTAQPFTGTDGTGTGGAITSIALNVVNSAPTGIASAQDAAEQEARRRRIARAAVPDNPVVIVGL